MMLFILHAAHLAFWVNFSEIDISRTLKAEITILKINLKP